MHVNFEGYIILKMGKVRKTKPSRVRRSEPVDNTSDEEEQLPVDSKENALQTILDQLQVSQDF